MKRTTRPRDSAGLLRAALNLENLIESRACRIIAAIGDPELVKELAPLLDSTHESRLRQAYLDRTGRHEMDLEPPAINPLLEEILAGEETAQEFYTRHAATIEDPELRELFAGLAREERSHAYIVKELIEQRKQVETTNQQAM